VDIRVDLCLVAAGRAGLNVSLGRCGKSESPALRMLLTSYPRRTLALFFKVGHVVRAELRDAR
jgi:hypothetical protein